jgi:tRNA(fMet)-specific endonuclease VapC
MLDTNALSELVRNPQGTLAQKLNALDPDTVCTSIVAACELRFGAQRKGSAPLTQRVEQLLQALTVLPLDAPADEHYADIRATLERSGAPINSGIGSHDLFIAAHARSRGMTLLTRKLREFQRVPGLTVEDWPSEPSSATPPQKKNRADTKNDREIK